MVIIAVVVILLAAGIAVRLWLWPVATGELLTITRPAGGTIVSDDGIQCGTQGAQCSVSRPRGATVRLRAVADAGFVFSGFTGDCASSGPAVVMTAARTCGATFSAAGTAVTSQYEVTVDPPSNGTIQGAGIRCGTLGSDCSIKQASGTQITLTAEPDNGFTFAAFTGDCAPSGTMTGPGRCGATFVPVAVTPTDHVLAVAKPTGGTILGPGIKCGADGSQCQSRQAHGVSVTLTAQADKGYKFAAFTGDCRASGRIRMVADRRCGATFVKESAPPPVPVLTIVPPTGGTIIGTRINCGTGGAECSAPHAPGSSVTLKAQPDAGFKFVAFTGDCDASGTTVMAASRTCGATFAAVPAPPPPGAGSEWFTNLLNTRTMVARPDTNNMIVVFFGASEFAGYTAILKGNGRSFAGEARRQGCQSPSRVTLAMSGPGVFVGQFELRACSGGRTTSKTGLVLSEKR